MPVFSLSCEKLTEEDPSGELGGTGCQVRDPGRSPMNPPHLTENIQWTRDAWFWSSHGSVVSPLVKSGWGEGKRKEKGGRKCLHLHWLLDVGNRIDYSNHRAVAATRHWLNGYISSTSSQISPDGWLWEFSMSYNCSGPGNQIVALFSMRAIVPGMLEDSWCPHYG